MTPEEYVAIVGQRLQSAGNTISTAQLPRGEALVGHRSQFRLQWMATKLHLLTVVIAVPRADGPSLEQFANDALAWADAQKGAYRGLQVGVGAVPVMVAAETDPSAIELAKDKLIRKFAKFAWPTVVDLSSGVVQRHEGHVALGGIYAKWIREQIALTVPDPKTL
jgi:hypothetical protein